jgi:hypothetical protein
MAAQFISTNGFPVEGCGVKSVRSLCPCHFAVDENPAVGGAVTAICCRDFHRHAIADDLIAIAEFASKNPGFSAAFAARHCGRERLFLSDSGFSMNRKRRVGAPAARWSRDRDVDDGRRRGMA